MLRSLKAALAGWKQLYYGVGKITLDAGNMANAPGNPPVQFGTYQFIQPPFFPSMAITDIPTTPPMYRNDGTDMQVNVYGLSGRSGGGTTGDVPGAEQGGVYYFDPTTNQYLETDEPQ